MNSLILRLFYESNEVIVSDENIELGAHIEALPNVRNGTQLEKKARAQSEVWSNSDVLSNSGRLVVPDVAFNCAANHFSVRKLLVVALAVVQDQEMMACNGSPDAPSAGHPV